MPRFAYVDGVFLPHGEAAVHIEDRGFQFGDAVYEVWAVAEGLLNDADGHFDRLGRSLSELRIPEPMGRAALEIVLKETVRRNRLREGLLYLQVSRGVARRDHAFPDPEVRPTVVVTARRIDPAQGEAKAAAGVAVITMPEIRWGRCDIKSVNLLPNVLARQAAREAGAYETWFVDELGCVTEGAATNAWIVDSEGVLRTRDIQANILRGVTRASLMKAAVEAGIRIEERAFTLADARVAREAFITGASTQVTAVVRLDGHAVGDGKPGKMAKRLRQLYIEEARRTSV